MNKYFFWGFWSGLVFGCLLFFFSILNLFICSTSLILLVCLSVSLIVYTTTALLITGLHLAHSPKNSLLSQPDLTFLCNMDQCTVNISCILISFGSRCLKSVGFFSVYASFRASCQIMLPPSRVSKWKNSREGDRRVCLDILFTTYV